MATRTDLPNDFTARLTDVEYNMVSELKEHYHFKTNRQLLLALVKRAHLSLPIKQTN